MKHGNFKFGYSFEYFLTNDEGGTANKNTRRRKHTYINKIRRRKDKDVIQEGVIEYLDE